MSQVIDIPSGSVFLNDQHDGGSRCAGAGNTRWLGVAGVDTLVDVQRDGRHFERSVLRLAGPGELRIQVRVVSVRPAISVSIRLRRHKADRRIVDCERAACPFAPRGMLPEAGRSSVVSVEGSSRRTRDRRVSPRGDRGLHRALQPRLAPPAARVYLTPARAREELSRRAA